ncbi:MAG: nucleotide pyrophosphohydrolase [Candidatus Woesearchaeota archaeon]|nr:nucleotide pyrophosphohydrolase [Candidatus Woesearchaeota archaeon]
MKELQKKIKKFCKENNLESPIEHRVLDTISELGEVAKEILKMSDYGRKPIELKKESMEKLKPELGDLLFSVITLANSLNIDLEDALDIALKKYEKRLKKGSAGSEND